MSLNPAPILLMHRGPASVREVLTATAAGPPDLAYTDRADQLQRHLADHRPPGAGHAGGRPSPTPVR